MPLDQESQTIILPQPQDHINAIPLYKPGKSIKGAHKLSSNENPLGCSELAQKAMTECLMTPQTYPDGNAVALREAIAKEEGIEPERIICGAGSDEIIGMLCKSYLGAGDSIVQSQHGFLMYSIYAAQSGAATRYAPESNYTTNVDAILDAVSNTTKLVFIANPNNPTGTVLPFAEIERLADSLPMRVILVLDGAYAEYVDAKDYADGIALVKARNNVFVTRTFSKIHGLAALRVGWGYGPTAIIDTLNKVRSPFNVSQIGQAAARASIKDRAFTARSVKHNRAQMQRVCSALETNGVDYTPSVGNFVLAHGPTDQPHFAEALYQELIAHGVIARLVTAYGLPNALRISIGTELANTAVIKAVEAFVRAREL